jgi:hypothetical protein
VASLSPPGEQRDGESSGDRGEQEHLALVRMKNLSSAAAISGPTSAPALSIARWSPYARPRSPAGTRSASNASRGDVRMPLPTRSANRIASTWSHVDARPTSGRTAAAIEYPGDDDRLAARRPVRPPADTAFISDAVASATPSISPSAAGRRRARA